MTSTDTQTYRRALPAASGGSAAKNSSGQCDSAERLANGLGWFSIGLGLAELFTPRAVAALIGVTNDSKTRSILRSYGLREIMAGVGILSQPRPVTWLWGRVAGDALDLASLAGAFGSSENNTARLTFATVAVAGVTALDLKCVSDLSSSDTGESSVGVRSVRDKKPSKAAATITVDRSPEDAYDFYRNFDNLPTFMTYLDSVTSIGAHRSHWVACGPAGMKIEWDAELVTDQPGELISWRSVDSKFANTGSVTFRRAPGQRGTVVSVEMDFAPDGGVLNSSLGRILGSDVGQRIQHDLRNFKQVLELGEVTQSDASIHPGMHPAHPPATQQV